MLEEPPPDEEPVEGAEGLVDVVVVVLAGLLSVVLVLDDVSLELSFFAPPPLLL